MSQLRVPKRHVQVVLSLATGPVEAEVFLSDYARVHGGSETILDLLDSDEQFFPARTDGQMRFIAVCAVANEPAATFFNSWIPVDAESWAVLERVKSNWGAMRSAE